MDKLFNWTSTIFGVIGGMLAHLLGGWDAMLITLVVLVCVDYISGVIKAFINKEVSSEIGFKGICKKVCMFLVVAAASAVQQVTGDVLPLREIVILFFIANEGISLLENAAQMNIPIPQKFKNFLLQLRDKNQDEQTEEK